jgi:hypothetical protein
MEVYLSWLTRIVRALSVGMVGRQRRRAWMDGFSSDVKSSVM